MDKIAIVEDEKSCANMLQNYVIRYNQENNMNVQSDIFTNAIDFLSDYDGSYFAVFMDIDMPMMNGMDAARKLRRTDRSVSIIFTTNLANYAINGYEVGALDFIVKPVAYFNFISKLERAMTIRDLRTDFPVVISLKDRKEIIRMSELYYVEGDDHFVIYHTAKGDFRARKTMNEVAQELKGNVASCGKSYIVNLSQVEAISSGSVTVHGVVLPVSHTKEKEFMRALTLYLGGAKRTDV